MLCLSLDMLSNGLNAMKYCGAVFSPHSSRSVERLTSSLEYAGSLMEGLDCGKDHVHGLAVPIHAAGIWCCMHMRHLICLAMETHMLSSLCMGPLCGKLWVSWSMLQESGAYA